MALTNFDAYIEGRSYLHTWTPRLKLIGLGVLMFSFAAVKHLVLVAPMLCAAALLYSGSGLPLSFLRKRLRYPGLFILAVVLVLPFSAGETVLAQWGPLALRQEGLITMTLVVGRFLSILTVGFVLLGTTPFLTLLRAMRSLGLPTILADMTLLTYRYLFETANMLSTMQQSMHLRGFGYHRKRWLKVERQTLSQLAGLLGSLLIRSYERSERVYQAMQLRGYGQLNQAQLTARQPIDSASWVLTGACAIIAIAFITFEVVLSIP